MNRRMRTGFTLIEVLLSMTIMLTVLGIATNLFRRQGAVIAAQSGRLEAQQTAQFTLSALDRELRLAGVGVVDMQPILVQADTLAITFNADLVSNVIGDASAVYIDNEASDLMSTVFRSAYKTTLPRSSKFYPDSTYMRAAGVPSGAETIALWLSKDSSSTATNEYVLWRRVNHGAIHLAAKGIVKNPTDTIFQYFKGDTAGVLTAIAPSALPLFHTATTHGQPSDTGKFALVDSIRTIRVRLTVVYHDRNGDVFRRLDNTIRLMNAGLIRRSTCGDPPTGVTPTAVAGLDTTGTPQVVISWPKSSDETAGEKDVERYALYRRPNGSPTTADDVFASVPAGSVSYAFTDTDVKSGEQWIYGAASQDCTPNSSSVTFASSVTIP
ncbi:MAG: prepilin-type N-terminal cleavage/methylation domain-containing protein [Gemmatimonadota bacterium]